MTENLLLHAESLREDGDLDASIELLRVVISQCNSDARKGEEERYRVTDENNVEGSIQYVKTTRKLRQTAAYQLALLLLQRSGRQSSNVPDDIDEKEADNLLWKLGYRLRLSKNAFGYPRCSNCRQHAIVNDQQSPLLETLSENKNSVGVGVAVIDKLLPTSIFDALQHAFRPGSRYWSEFYTKKDDGQDRFSSANDNRTSHFASHNISLPSCNKASSATIPLSDILQRSKSLLEQVAIIAQHRLQERFPDVLKATSVEVWSHRRPSDGHHQLHYDMDEIRLWEHRLRKLEEQQNKRHKSHGDTEICGNIEANRRRDRSQKICNDGVSCPIVSCVVTIDVPGESNCCLCEGKENSAPTIICNQSIVSGNGCQSNSGCICFPIPNRLLAFEGSLLHGVMPGIPFANASSTISKESNDSYSDREEDMETCLVNSHRVTFMMGFWESVCTTTPTSSNTSEEFGPNLPFDSMHHDNNWKKEFKAHSVTGNDFAAFGANVSQPNEQVNVFHLYPLWVPVKNHDADKSFGEFQAGNATRQHGRFFLKSTDPTEIDYEVLTGDFSLE